MAAVSPLLVIVGPTASGKSGLALKVSQELSGEIIAADSWTVRKGCNIGTAKPNAHEQALVPHHLIDIVEPCADFTAAVFKDLAHSSIADISGRSKLPMLVGGTGLYVDGILYDYSFLPHASRVDRGELNALTAEQLVELAHSSGLSTEAIDERNKRRVIRLIETGGQAPTKKTMRNNTYVVGLRPSKEDLHNNITQRVDAMLAAGLKHEVAQLVEQYGWECEALKGIGYSQWRDFYEGDQSLAQTRERIIANTRQLAKRQITWFKRNKSIQWFSSADEAYAYIGSIKNYLIHKQ